MIQTETLWGGGVQQVDKFFLCIVPDVDAELVTRETVPIRVGEIEVPVKFLDKVIQFSSSKREVPFDQLKFEAHAQTESTNQAAAKSFTVLNDRIPPSLAVPVEIFYMFILAANFETEIKVSVLPWDNDFVSFIF